MGLAAQVSDLLGTEGVRVRVVSMPCWELFDEQPLHYRKSVFPRGVPVIAVEAASVEVRARARGRGGACGCACAPSGLDR